MVDYSIDMTKIAELDFSLGGKIIMEKDNKRRT